MRIISGKFKGKKLLTPNDNLIRPTSDRAKETIFNILESFFLKKKCISSSSKCTCKWVCHMSDVKIQGYQDTRIFIGQENINLTSGQYFWLVL